MEEALPPGTSHETAQHILFIGKAVRVLRPPQGSLLEDQLDAGVVLEQLQATRGWSASLLETAVDRIRGQACP